MAEHETQRYWNGLEITKLAVSILTPVVLVLLAYLIDRAIDDRRHWEQMQVAAQDFSRFVYERYTRTTLLWSALKRNADSPISESRIELIERKRLYDEAYVDWNRNVLANVFNMRKILGTSKYSDIEKIVNESLIQKMFAPLDRCLTKTYDQVFRTEVPKPPSNNCKKLLDRSFYCGRNIAEYLFTVSMERSTDLPLPVCK